MGLQANRWNELMRMHLSNSVTDELCIVYVARELSAGQQQLEDTEDITFKRIHFDEALQMVLRHEITDAISVAALLRIAADREKFLYPEN